MTRSPGNKKDDPSFKTLLARLDGSFDTAPPYDPALLVALPTRSGGRGGRRSKGNRRLVWAGISAGMTALAVGGFLAMSWITRPSALVATAGPSTPQRTLPMSASLTLDQLPRPIEVSASPMATVPMAQTRTVLTQVIPVQTEALSPAVGPPRQPQPTTVLPARSKVLAQAHAQQPAGQEADGPPVPLVSRPSPPAELERREKSPSAAAPVVPADVKLLVAPSQRARAGESTPFPIKVEAAGQPLDRLRVAFSGLADGVTLMPGGSMAAGVWYVPARGIERLQIALPVDTGYDMTLSLELLDGPGNSLARASTHIIVLPAPPAPPKPATPVVAAQPPPVPSATPPSPPAAAQPRLSMDEDTALIERGRLLARNGDIAAARLLFERAADAGNGRAALLLGETFDPEVLAGMGVLGAKGDLAKARRWYARANELGVPLAAERLKALAGR